MDRRSFIKNTSVGLGAVGQMRVGQMNLSSFDSLYQVDEENDNILVIVQLFGGNDGINTIIPHEWPDYYDRFRPRLHIPSDASIGFADPKLGIAMHPSLTNGVNEGMLGMYKNGKLSVIQGVGYQNPNLSHFRSTDIWFSGIVPYNDGQKLPTGWLGRYFDQYQNKELPESPYCIHVGESPLLLFQGENKESAILLEDPEELFDQGKSVESEKIELGEQSLFADEFNYINEVGVRINHFSKSIKEAFDRGSNREDYQADNLSNQMKLVARLIDGGLKTKVYSVSLGGFDTHAGQGALGGVHSQLLYQMSAAISSFQSDIEKLGHSSKVVGITVSEFGRRPYENASSGTDHGTANVMFAFGDEVKPEVFGSNVAFLPFFDAENLAYRYDFRSIYQEIMRTWFGASTFLSETVLGGKFALIDKVGFLKSTQPDASLPAEPVVPEINQDPKSPNNPYSPYSVTEQDKFTAFPNPTTDGKFVLSMILYVESDVAISQIDFKGREMGELLKKKNYRPGSYFLPLELRGGAGLHILHIKVGHRNHYVKVMKL
ncbi:DUF1501 domain-containing protein [Jiulongibacter sediminis]|jgi:uncharacterized protein (DUF1501 family)|uniref:DUF1501 domain-containing protein n=1 Tax=Jiulongibacter sediminis TaxID=1605367 RepID=UPI0026EC0BA0|nr:DUF1501 domain-containing protein [Jiulongibacter sediminis]